LSWFSGLNGRCLPIRSTRSGVNSSRRLIINHYRNCTGPCIFSVSIPLPEADLISFSRCSRWWCCCIARDAKVSAGAMTARIIIEQSLIWIVQSFQWTRGICSHAALNYRCTIPLSGRMWSKLVGALVNRRCRRAGAVSRHCHLQSAGILRRIPTWRAATPRHLHADAVMPLALIYAVIRRAFTLCRYATFHLAGCGDGAAEWRCRKHLKYQFYQGVHLPASPNWTNCHSGYAQSIGTPHVMHLRIPFVKSGRRQLSYSERQTFWWISTQMGLD